MQAGHRFPLGAVGDADVSVDLSNKVANVRSGPLSVFMTAKAKREALDDLLRELGNNGLHQAGDIG